MFALLSSSKNFLVLLWFCLLPASLFPSWEVENVLICLNTKGNFCHKQKNCTPKIQTDSCCAKKKYSSSTPKSSCHNRVISPISNSTPTIHSKTCQCLRLFINAKTLTFEGKGVLESFFTIPFSLFPFSIKAFSSLFSSYYFFRPPKLFPTPSQLEKTQILLV